MSATPAPKFLHRKIVIPRSTMKIIFYNVFLNVLIVFENSKTYTIEVLFKGMRSLCLCDKNWRKTVLSRRLTVCTLKPMDKQERYFYLQKVDTPNAPPGHITICVKTIDKVFSMSFLSMMQIRSINYTDCGKEAAERFQGQLPIPCIKWLSASATKMTTEFFGIGNHIRPCTAYQHFYCTVHNAISIMYSDIADTDDEIEASVP